MPEERPPALRRLGKLPKCCEMPRKELSPPASPCNDCSGAFIITEKTSIDCETKAVLPSSCNAPLAFLGGKASEVLRPRTERGSEQEGAKVWKLKPATEILTDKKLLFSSVQAKALGRSPEAVLGCPQPPPPSLCKLCVNKSKRVFCWDKGDTTSYPASYTVHQASGQAAGSQESYLSPESRWWLRCAQLRSQSCSISAGTWTACCQQYLGSGQEQQQAVPASHACKTSGSKSGFLFPYK